MHCSTCGQIAASSRKILMRYGMNGGVRIFRISKNCLIFRLKQIYSMRHVLPRGRSSTHNSGRVDGPGGGRARGRFKGLLACKLEWLGRRKRQRCLAFPIDRDAREREGPRTASRCSPSASYCRKVEVSVGAKGVIDRDCSLFYVRCEEGVVGSVVKR